MNVRTSAGELLIVAHPQDSAGELLLVFGKVSALQALVDGIEMSYAVEDGGEVEPLPTIHPHQIAGHGTLVASKRQLAIWIQFEILNFL